MNNKKMGITKTLLLSFAVAGAVLSSCSSSASVISAKATATAPSTALPTSSSTITPTNTPIPSISKTQIDLSSELYLDENSSPDNLKGEPFHQDYVYFNGNGESKGQGLGFIYKYNNEEWVAALTWSRIFPFNDNLHPNEGELRQHYVQVWKDGKMLYTFPIEGICCDPKRIVRYEDHWIFWFMDDWYNRGWVVQDGILLNELHSYDNAFSVFLLNDKPFFFFRRDDQYGISFDGQEVLLPYPNISYGPICCESGGTGRWNPRGTDKMVGFYVKRGDSDYQYIEIGLK